MMSSFTVEYMLPTQPNALPPTDTLPSPDTLPSHDTLPSPAPLPSPEETAVHRDDGELLGTLQRAGDAWIPRTVFGYALHQAVAHSQAVAYLHTHGLSCLADAWELNEGGTWLNVRIIEANQRSLTLAFADYGRADLFGERRTLQTPIGEALRRA